MPEGDTIYRTAEVLRSVLMGREVTAARAQPQPGLRRVPDLTRLVGTRVSTVEARGKHLLIGFDGGFTLRTHMRMRGSWHQYRPGEPWRRPAREATVVLETADAVAVCFNAPVAELLTNAHLVRNRPLTTLGPDLLADNFDAAEAIRRLRERSHLEFGEALLDQRAVAGMGNVYKSEVCFIERLNPWAPVGAFDDQSLRAALSTARQLMLANVRGGARVTTNQRARGRGLWVYGRAGRPCRRCGTRIDSARQGELARTTYWCPRCQRVPTTS
jgi:endonuclease-8